MLNFSYKREANFEFSSFGYKPSKCQQVKEAKSKMSAKREFTAASQGNSRKQSTLSNAQSERAPPTTGVFKKFEIPFYWSRIVTVNKYGRQPRNADNRASCRRPLANIDDNSIKKIVSDLLSESGKVVQVTVKPTRKLSSFKGSEC